MVGDREKDVEIESSVNIVGVSKGKRLIIIVILLIFAALIYYIFFSGDGSNGENKDAQVKEADIDKLIKESKKVTQETVPITTPTQLPELPALITPSLPAQSVMNNLPVLEKPVLDLPKITVAPPSVTPALPLPPSGLAVAPPVSTVIGSSSYDKERRSSAMLVIGGQEKKEEKLDAEGKVIPEQNLLSDDAPLAMTTATNSRATRMGNLNFTIAQGKMLDAVLETAINSDLPGMLRAVISRDIYAESGNFIMIPKGSRLIGGYSFSGEGGQRRIGVIWNRVILPHGIDIEIDSPGTDELGRQGLTGIVDMKIENILMSTILLGGVSFGSAVIVSQIPGMNDKVVITPPTPVLPEGSKTTTLPYEIIEKSIDDMSKSIKEIIEKNKDVKPTIYVDQGTAIKVFVNKDLSFPPAAIAGAKVLQ